MYDQINDYTYQLEVEKDAFNKFKQPGYLYYVSIKDNKWTQFEKTDEMRCDKKVKVIKKEKISNVWNEI